MLETYGSLKYFFYLVTIHKTAKQAKKTSHRR